LDTNIIVAESKQPFVMAYREEFAEGDFDAILTEAQKSRLFYLILDKVKVKDTSGFIGTTLNEHPISNQGESLIYYLKRSGLLEEITPLWNKAKIVRAAKEGHNDVQKSKLMN
jgi:hypothetical protein